MDERIAKATAEDEFMLRTGVKPEPKVPGEEFSQGGGMLTPVAVIILVVAAALLCWGAYRLIIEASTWWVGLLP